MPDYVPTTRAELDGLDDEELVERLANARQELFNVRFQVATSEFKNTSRLRALRREIAQLLTVQRAREISLAYEYYETQLKEGSG